MYHFFDVPKVPLFFRYFTFYIFRHNETIQYSHFSFCFRNMFNVSKGPPSIFQAETRVFRTSLRSFLKSCALSNGLRNQKGGIFQALKSFIQSEINNEIKRKHIGKRHKPVTAHIGAPLKVQKSFLNM